MLFHHVFRTSFNKNSQCNSRNRNTRNCNLKPWHPFETYTSWHFVVQENIINPGSQKKAVCLYSVIAAIQQHYTIKSIDITLQILTRSPILQRLFSSWAMNFEVRLTYLLNTGWWNNLSTATTTDFCILFETTIPPIIYSFEPNIWKN